jgi:two-component system copper resistance phosphate regulon response regulator CusR
MRVLIVEDDAALSRLLKRGLTEAGFSVDTAADGESGLHLATAEAFDAVVLDLMVPRVSGLDVLRTLRARGRNVPVLILTARDGVGDRVAGLDRGADDYLTKPFVLAELVARLRALIRRYHRVAHPVVRVADLVVDLAARRVARAGRTIELPAKQFALLELLALQQGYVVSRTQIHEKIWDGDSDTLSNVVDVHVCRLRDLVDRDFGQRLIHTVRGQGYVLAAKEVVPCRCDGA